jgi:hypothetical protein
MHLLHLGHFAPDTLPDLGFLVVAPSQRLDDITNVLQPAALVRAIQDRDPEADGHDEWCSSLVVPEVGRMRIEALAWETLIEEISALDPEYGGELLAFYGQCLRFNGLQGVSAA